MTYDPSTSTTSKYVLLSFILLIVLLVKDFKDPFLDSFRQHVVLVKLFCNIFH